MNIANNINTYADLTAYNADTNKDYPNVSYIEGTDEVKWYKYDPDHIVAVYNVTSTESATTLLYMNSNITYQIIDGVQQQSVQTSYTFSTTGEHIVKYKLSGTAIAQYLFNSCSNLTSVTIPNNVTTIGQYAFEKSGITSVNIPDGVTRIESYTFNRCKSLLSINIPSGVTYIGDASFFDCSGLTSITVNATTPPTLVGNNVFDNTGNAPIYVPAASVNAYKAASKWDEYASRIQAIQ